MPWSSPFANSPQTVLVTESKPIHGLLTVQLSTLINLSYVPSSLKKCKQTSFHTNHRCAYRKQKATIFMATISAMAVVLSAARSMSIKSPRPAVAAPPAMRPTSLQNLPRGLTLPKLLNSSSLSAALAGAVFSTLSSTADAAFAAQQIADIAEGDNRGLALLIPIIPAILWVLYNILQPALNQLNRMRSEKSFVVGLGLVGGLAAAAATGLLSTPDALALQQVADVAESSGDNRGLALLIPIIPAILWVLYNILQPALNQINRMRSG